MRHYEQLFVALSAVHPDTVPEVVTIKEAKGLVANSLKTISMVTSCPEGHVLGRLCTRQESADQYDYKLDLPVLSGQTGAWFQNVYCAVCHGFETTVRKQFLSFKCTAPNGTQLLPVTRLGAPGRPRSHATHYVPSTFDNAVDTDGSYETEYGVAKKDNATAAPHDDRSYAYVFQVLQGGKYKPGMLLWVTDTGGSCHLYPELPPPSGGQDAVPWERPCMQLVDRCPENWAGDKEVAVLCASYAYHVVGSKTYKNPHCAICNNETLTLRCRKGTDARRRPSSHPPVSLRLIMDYEWDPGRDGCISRGGVWDALHSRCQSLDDVCPKGARYLDGRCVSEAEGGAAPNGGGGGGGGGEAGPAAAAGGEKRDVAGGELEVGEDGDGANDTCLRITLQRDEFVLENASLRLTLPGSPFYGLVLAPGDFRLLGDGRAQVCNVYQYALVPTDTVQGYMTAVCLAVSAVCLTLHLIVHAMLPKLHNLPGKNLQALSAALLLAQLGFLLGVSPPGEVPAAPCEAIAAAVHFFYLAAFCWMNVMSVDIWRTFAAATGRTAASHRRYAAYAWGLPAAVVALSLAADHAPALPHALRPGYAEAGICWFGSGAGLGYYLALPVTLILVGNMALFGVTVFQLHRRQEGSRYLRRQRRDERSERSCEASPSPAPAPAANAQRSPAPSPTHHSGPRDQVLAVPEAVHHHGRDVADGHASGVGPLARAVVPVRGAERAAGRLHLCHVRREAERAEHAVGACVWPSAVARAATLAALHARLGRVAPDRHHLRGCLRHALRPPRAPRQLRAEIAQSLQGCGSEWVNDT